MNQKVFSLSNIQLYLLRFVCKCWENTKISWSRTYLFPIKVAVFLGTPIYPPFLHKAGHDFFRFSPTLVTNLGLSENVGEKGNILIWLVVSTPLKDISQFVSLFPIYGKIKNVPNHQPVMVNHHLPHSFNGLFTSGSPSK